MKKYQGTAPEWAMHRRGSAAVWIVWIILAILIGGGLFYYYQYVEIPTLQKQIDDLNAQIQTLQQSKQSTETDETADWETYSNTALNYSIKYPKDWKLYSGIVDQKKEATPTSETVYFVKDNMAYIQIYKDTSHKTRESAVSYLESTVISDQPKNQRSESIPDVSGTIKTGERGAGEKVEYTVYTSGNDLFIMKISKEDKYQELESTIQNMLVSFQVTG